MDTGTSQTGTDGGGSERTRVPNRWGEGQRLRQDILQAAKRLLQDGGRPEAVSLRGIAREAGISAPAIYKHFKDKSELLLAVLDGVYAELAETMRAAARSAPNGDSWAAVRIVVDAYCRFATQQRQRYQLMFHIGPMLPERQRPERCPLRHVLEVWREVVQAYLDDAAAETDAGPGPAMLSSEDVPLLLWSGLHGQLTLWWSVTHDKPEQSIVDLRDALLLSLFGRR